MELPPNEPKTLTEFLWYIMEYKNEIFFRAKRNGKWGNVSLAKLTPKEFGERIAETIETGRLPVRIKREGES